MFYLVSSQLNRTFDGLVLFFYDEKNNNTMSGIVALSLILKLLEGSTEIEGVETKKHKGRFC